MSLRTRLALLLTTLVLFLALGQWWLVRSLTRELDGELAAAAAEVGTAVARLLEGEPEEGGKAGGAEHRVLVKVVRVDGEGAPAELGGGSAIEEIDPDAVLPLPSGGPHRIRVDHERDVVLLRGPGLERRLAVPNAGVRSELDRFARRLLAGSLALLAAGLVVASVVTHRVTAPLAGLSRAAERLAGGELGAQAPERGGAEVAQTVRAFNRMSRRLAELDADAAALRASRHLGELAEVGRGLAHSLRSPLHALGLAVDELAARGGGDELAAEARQQIRRVDAGLRALVALGGDAGAAQPADLDVAAVARDVALEALQTQAITAGGAAPVAVRVEPDAGDEPIVLRAVEAELRILLHTLVVNAVEASPAGAVVDVLVRPAPDGVEVVVEDRGPGLPPAVRRRLFSPHLTTKPQGAGLGLFLAQRLASGRYGGELAIEERAGGGTRARLHLAGRAEDARG